MKSIKLLLLLVVLTAVCTAQPPGKIGASRSHTGMCESQNDGDMYVPALLNLTSGVRLDSLVLG